jgi:hypothetical protein
LPKLKITDKQYIEAATRKRGRPFGAVSQVTIQAKALAMASGLLPHELLLDWARGEPMRVPQADGSVEDVFLTVDQRIDVAKAAAPFYSPRLAAATVDLNAQVGYQAMSDSELDDKLNRLLSLVDKSVDNSITDLEALPVNVLSDSEC